MNENTGKIIRLKKNLIVKPTVIKINFYLVIDLPSELAAFHQNQTTQFPRS